MPRASRIPKYTLHRPSGQARVRIDGKDHYLGEYRSPESRDRYEELVSAWLARQDVGGVTLTIDELTLLYLEFAKDYYVKDGEPTREVGNIRAVLRRLVASNGRVRVREFSPVRLEEFRDALLGDTNRRSEQSGKPLSRTYINTAVRKITRMFKWGVRKGHVPVGVWQALTAIEGLKKGRSKARETQPVRPADSADVNAVLPLLSPPVRAMVELQRVTGVRPGEVMALRPCDVTRRVDGIWAYRPPRHKNEHHGQERIVFLGPKAQAILAPWLDRDAELPCFCPQEAVAWRRAERRKQRQTPVQPSQQDRSMPKPKRQPGLQYTEGAYRAAIHRAIARLNKSRRENGLPETGRWSPNQLRHGVATVVREQYGLEAAQVLLGHAKADTTQLYAERDQRKAAEIAKAIG